MKKTTFPKANVLPGKIWTNINAKFPREEIMKAKDGRSDLDYPEEKEAFHTMTPNNPPQN